MKETFITVFRDNFIDEVLIMSVDESAKQTEKKSEKKEEFSLEEKIEKVRAVEALRRSGYTVEEACRVVGIHRTTYYKWRDELSEYIKDDLAPQSKGKDISETYQLLEQYGFKTPSSEQPNQPSQPSQGGGIAEQVSQLKKELDRIRALVGGSEGVINPSSSSEDLEEIKRAIAFLLKKFDEIQRGQVYMGRVKKVKHPDGTEIEYDLLPQDYAAVKQANTMYDKAVPELLNELKGIRGELTMFGNRLLGLIETNLAHEIKKAPGFFLNPKKRSKEEKERELEEIEKMLEGKELLSMKIGGDLGEVPSNDVGEGWSRENDGGE